MKYERLTERDKDGKALCNCGYYRTRNNAVDGEQLIYDESIDEVQELLDRLAELEDKIEQGTLIELPCKVGDTVCKYHVTESSIKIISGTVSKIEMRKNGIWIYITTLPNFYYDKALIGDFNKGFIDTTCYYFCPVEEAEAKLKELQNG